MSARKTESRRSAGAGNLERSAWIAFLVCITIVPLAVGKLPLVGRPMTYTVFAFPQTATLAITCAFALALWGAAAIAGETRLVLSRWMIPFAAFLAWAGIATVAAYEPLRSFFGSSTSALSLAQILAYTSVFFLATQLLDSRDRMRALTWCVVGAGALVGFLALLQQLFSADLFGLPLPNDWILSRGFSTIGNPDHLGTFLVVPVLLSALLFLYESELRDRVTAGVCLATTLTAMAGTLTRGAMVAVVIGVVLLVVVRLRSGARLAQLDRRALVAIALCVLAVGIALVAADRFDLASRINALRSSFAQKGAAAAVNTLSSDRLNLWKSTMQIAAQRPLTGVGPAAFELGWYPNAINPSSAGGEGALADDPHSIAAYVLATTGVPGLLAYLVAAVGAIVIGLRNALSQMKGHAPSGTLLYYLAWTVAAIGLHTALLLAAVSTPIITYSFLSLAVLIRPSAKPLTAENPAVRLAPAGLALGVALVLLSAIVPQLRAETALARANDLGSVDVARQAALIAPWNLDVQKAYFHMYVTQVSQSVDAGRPEAKDEVRALVDELSRAGGLHPHELYYPSVRTQVLTQASEKLRDTGYAKDAISAADVALAIMPAHIPTRVNKALALSDLKRYAEMADTLSGYWRNELTSAYPGLLYAQALALSGKPAQAREVFDELRQRFPDDPSIDQVQADTEKLIPKK